MAINVKYGQDLKTIMTEYKSRLMRDSTEEERPTGDSEVPGSSTSSGVATKINRSLNRYYLMILIQCYYIAI